MFGEEEVFMFIYGYLLQVIDTLKNSCLYWLGISCFFVDMLLLIYVMVYDMVELVLRDLSQDKNILC